MQGSVKITKCLLDNNLINKKVKVTTLKIIVIIHNCN